MAMTANEFEKIKGKIDTLKAKKAKAEGAMEAEEANWKKLYKANSKKDMEDKLEEAEDELKMVEDKMETLETELKGLTNWALV